jgi:hypothetical protein
MLWSEYVARLPGIEHRRLALGMGSALRETRLAASVLDSDGELVDLVEHLEIAIGWLTEIRAAIGEVR